MNIEDVRAIARGSKVFDLGVELFPGMPHVPLHGPFGYSMIREHGDFMISGGACSAVDTFFCTGHTGTHIDALGHIAQDMKLTAAWTPSPPRARPRVSKSTASRAWRPW